MSFRRLFLILGSLFALGAPRALADVPSIVTDIRPILGIATAMAYGITTPQVVLENGATPHDYAMRPSDAAKLRGADVVFWLGPRVSPFLSAAVATLPKGVVVVDLSRAPGVAPLAARHGGVWETDALGHDHARELAPDEAAIDPHLWLDPDNAQAMARAMADTLSRIDPDRASNYAAKLNLFRTTIDNTDTQIRAMLAPVRDAPFLVMHDAYQYFEKAFGLSPRGAATSTAATQPGARDVALLRDRAADGDIRCIIGEPSLDASPVRLIAGDAPIRVTAIDPLGRAIPASPLLYPSLLKEIAAAFRDCLSDPERR